MDPRDWFPIALIDLDDGGHIGVRDTLPMSVTRGAWVWVNVRTREVRALAQGAPPWAEWKRGTVRKFLECFAC